MEKQIACCGLNCAACDAQIATVSNNDELRNQTAEKWRAHFSPDITPEMINCTGCMESGAKFSHCNNCEIRNCVLSKEYQTCAVCDQMESCEILSRILQYVPEALENLRSLN